MRNVFEIGISHTILIDFLQKAAISHTLSGYFSKSDTTILLFIRQAYLRKQLAISFMKTTS